MKTRKAKFGKDVTREKMLQTVCCMVFLISCTFQSVGVSAQQTIVFDGPKFTQPLFNRWVSEYAKAHPDIVIAAAEKGREADLSVVSVPATGARDSEQLIFVSRYALLPVTTLSNAGLGKVKKRGLDKKDLTKLFFTQESDLYEQEESGNGPALLVYAGAGNSPAAVAFASHFGFDPAALKGKKVLGDDIYLLSAIRKDPAGITFNNLGYLYDLKTKKLQEDLMILPLAIEKENLVRFANLDETIGLLESKHFEIIPVAGIGFKINNFAREKEILAFIQWILYDGQQFNHEYGFLNIDEELLAGQRERLSAGTPIAGK